MWPCTAAIDGATDRIDCCHGETFGNRARSDRRHALMDTRRALMDMRPGAIETATAAMETPTAAVETIAAPMHRRNGATIGCPADTDWSTGHCADDTAPMDRGTAPSRGATPA
jgi:hypothetical protein